MDLTNLILHAYDDVRELTTEELQILISDIIDIDEIPFAISELYKRDSKSAILLGEKILENNLGDEYLQAAIFDFFFEKNKQYITKYIVNHLEQMDLYVFANMINRLTEEAVQQYGQNIPGQLLSSIASRYMLYSEKEKNKTEDKFNLFLSAYNGRI
jgi:hypothetical protein